MKKALIKTLASACLSWAAFASPVFAKCEISGDAVHTQALNVAHFEEEISKALTGTLVLANSTIVNPAKSKPPAFFDYSATVALSEGTDGITHVAVAALVSDDGCDVSVNGRRWLSQSGKGHDISKGLRRYDRLLLPGDENRFAIKYSQTFYDPAVLENDLDGLSLIVLPVPIDISVRDSSGKMNDRILVKKGETVEAVLNPVFWEHDLPSNDDIRWSIGQVDSSGNFTWKQLGETGAKISVPTSTAGIFKLRAEINGQHFYYQRHRDVLNNREQNDLLRGADDFIGVYLNSFQKRMVAIAYSHIGSTRFARASTIDLTPYGGIQPENDYAGANKCNIFIFVVAYECGVKNEFIKRWFRLPWKKTYTSPALHNEWSDSSEIIRCVPLPYWSVFGEKPIPGTVICGKSHLGVLDYDGYWINAGEEEVHKRTRIGSGSEQRYRAYLLRTREAN